MKIYSIIKLFRPHHYIKNFFILAPLVFSLRFTDLPALYATLLSFVLFSLLASSIYIFNDLLDVKEDRQHPIKRNRPFAKGDVKKSTAVKLIVLLVIVVSGVSFFFNIQLFIVLSVYFLLNLAYTLKLKHLPIIDIFIVAFGFILRLYAGAVVIPVNLTMWIILMTFLLALFLGLAKRRDDVLLAIEGKKTRKNVDGYNIEFINAGMITISAVTIVAYIFYTVSPEVTERFHTDKIYITVLFVIFGILRYMQLTFVKGESGDPTKLVLKDKLLQVTLFFWVISFVLIISIKKLNIFDFLP